MIEKVYSFSFINIISKNKVKLVGIKKIILDKRNKIFLQEFHILTYLRKRNFIKHQHRNNFTLLQ